MLCPVCSSESTVKDSRPARAGAAIRRRRLCKNAACNHRWTTFETGVDNMGIIASPSQRSVLATVGTLIRALDDRWSELETADLLARGAKRLRLRGAEEEKDAA